MLIDLSCPIENRGISVRTNSETGENYILLKLLNISEKTIVSVNLNVKAFDENGTEIASLPVEITELSANPKEYFAENKAISLSEIPDAKNFIVDVISATFENGEIYEPSEDNTIDYDDSEAPLADALALRELVPEAICYSSENDEYWRCACGRPNFLDAQNCARCGREKETVLTNYSSKSALNNTLLAIKEQEEQKALEEEMAREAKKKKKLKNIITTAIVVVSLAVLFVIGYFVRIGIINFQANTAVKNGDYLKAYELYSKTNSPKIAEITDKVMGNTPSNLMFGAGFLAEDDENIYYITRNLYSQPANLIKENKSTKEKTIVTDAAYGSLNVVGDYIYFLNNENFPCRMTKDGKTTETITETQTYVICVTGNDMYYIKNDYDNPKGFTEEECEILASQGQIETFTRIHKINLDTKEDVLVSNESVYMFSIYGNRIYYLTPNDTEDTWAMANLKSMNLNGEDVKSVVEFPVNSFFVKDDVLYYISCFNESMKGAEISDMSSFDYSIISLDLKTGNKTVVSDKNDLIMDMNVSGDSIIMISYNREAFFNYYSGASEDAAVPSSELKTYNIKTGETKAISVNDAVSINVCNETVFSISSNGIMSRMSIWGSGFESIAEDGTIIVPTEE